MDTLIATLLVKVGQGQSIQFENPIFEIDVPNPPYKVRAQMSDFQISIMGSNGTKGYVKRLPNTEELMGGGVPTATEMVDPAVYRTDVAFRIAAPPNELILNLPPVRLNGQSTIISPLKLFFVEEKLCLPLA